MAPQGLTQKLSISDLQASDVSPQSPLTADTPPGSEPNDSAVLDEMPSPSESLVVETGLASWYGPRFHGKLTASGEVYNQEGFTAAHRTLAWGDKVRVTNLRNGRSVVVQINDRGPAIKDRIIDLSRAAARALGMLQSGTARVKLTRLSTSERPGPVLAKQYFKD